MPSPICASCAASEDMKSPGARFITMNETTEMPKSVGTARMTRRTMYCSIAPTAGRGADPLGPPPLLLEEELRRVFLAVVAQRVVGDVAGLDVAEVVLRDHRHDELADRADREGGLPVHADQVLEERVPFRL